MRDLIREQDPLKQGLKHVFRAFPPAIVTIREQDPLKQGLKLSNRPRLITPWDIFVSKIH